MLDDELRAQLTTWLEDAKGTDLADPWAMTLSSVDHGGRPSSRIVLLRAFDARGFTFFTNLQSKKGTQLLAQPHAALCFHWPMLSRQLRIEGAVEQVEDAEADAYFASRPRESQIGAWASDQSRPLRDRGELLDRYAQVERRFAGGSVPRPPHWSGLRVIADTVEFWEQGDHRLHRRTLWSRRGAAWLRSLLYP